MSTLRQFTVHEYHRLVDAGILTEDDRVELLEGWIVVKKPRNPVHDAAILRISKKLNKQYLPPGWDLRIQSAITTSESEPEPDLAIVRETANDYADHHPAPSDVGLLIEVANTTLVEDRDDKGRIYARAQIPIYWLVNLVDRLVEVYSDPTGPLAQPVYRQRQDYGIGDSIPFILNGKEVARIAVSELLPP